MSTKQNNPAEEKQLSNTTNNKVNNMIYSMNLESVCGKEVVAQPAAYRN